MKSKKKIMNKITWVILLMIGCTANINSQAITDSTIAMVAFWGMDDEVVYEFKETEDMLSKGKKTLKTKNYDVIMTILDSTENSYSIRWNYENCKYDYELDKYEKETMAIFSDIPVQYRTTELGVFQTIENWEEMKNTAETLFDNWVSENKDLPDSLQLGLKNMLTGMFSSKDQMNFFAVDLKFFHYCYGANLSRTESFEAEKLYTNPFTKLNMAGTQRIEVIEVDEENRIAHINVKSGIDGDKAKMLMVDFMKQNMENLGIKDESEIKLEELPTYSVSEELNCLYHIDTGYILIGSFIKETTLNDDYKITTYEYDLKTE